MVPISPSISAFGVKAATGPQQRPEARAHRLSQTVLFTSVWLRYEEVFGIYTEVLGVYRIQGVFRVDKRASTASFLASAITCNVSVVLPEDSGP